MFVCVIQICLQELNMSLVDLHTFPYKVFQKKKVNN